jgi:hypothetical protein
MYLKTMVKLIEEAMINEHISIPLSNAFKIAKISKVYACSSEVVFYPYTSLCIN